MGGGASTSGDICCFSYVIYCKLFNWQKSAKNLLSWFSKVLRANVLQVPKSPRSIQGCNLRCSVLQGVQVAGGGEGKRDGAGVAAKPNLGPEAATRTCGGGGQQTSSKLARNSLKRTRRSKEHLHLAWSGDGVGHICRSMQEQGEARSRWWWPRWWWPSSGWPGWRWRCWWPPGCQWCWGKLSGGDGVENGVCIALCGEDLEVTDA